jgi:hypothetical protein
MEKKETLKKFVIDNKLDFSGSGSDLNGNCTILAGFTLFLNIEGDSSDILDIVSEIETIPDSVFTAELNEEFERVYDFAKSNNYGKFWNTEMAKKQYIF